MNLTQSTTKLFISNIAKASILFGAIVVFSRSVGASGIGLFFLFQGVVVILSLLADVGLRSSLEKRISEGLPADDLLATTLALKLPPLFLVVTGILMFRTDVNRYFGATVAIYLAVELLFYEAFMLTVKLLNGQLRVGETATLYVIQYTIWGVSSYALLELGWGPQALLLGFIIGTITGFITGLRRLSTTFGFVSRDLARSLLRFSRYEFLTYFRGHAYNWTDVLVIGYFLTVTDVGQYEVAWRVSAFVMVLSHSVATVIFPQVSKWSGEEATEKIQSVIPQAITASLFFVIPSFFAVAVFAREMLTVIFGKEFGAAWLILIILILDKVVEAFQVIFDRSLRGLDRPDMAAMAAVVSVGTNVVMNIVLVWQVGVVGAAMATLGASAIGIVLYAGALNFLIDISMPVDELLWCTISAGIMAGILVLLDWSVGVRSPFYLFGFVGIGAVVYLVLAFVPTTMRAKLRTLHRQALDSG